MANYEDRPLIGYVPNVLKNVREYQALTHGEQTEVFNLFAEIQHALDNQFVETSTEYGVMRWEKILELIPTSTMTLDERKFAVLAQLMKQLPYTYRMLEQHLTDLCGADNFEIILNPNEYSLKIRLVNFSSNNVEAVGKVLKQLCPANLDFAISNDTVQAVFVHYIGGLLQSTTYEMSASVDLTKNDEIIEKGTIHSPVGVLVTKQIVQSIAITI